MQPFKSKNLFCFFSYGLLKLGFWARKLSGAFEKWVPGLFGVVEALAGPTLMVLKREEEKVLPLTIASLMA